jgi:sugar phosphate isomerase/epimerase
MHLKDLKKGIANNMTGSTPPENSVVFGTGQVDMGAVVKAALKARVKYLYVEDESPIAHQQVPLSLAFLRSL